MLFQLPSKDKLILEPIKISSLMDAGWKEKDLENLLAENITSLIREDNLMPISQESAMQEEPDILALNEEGTLFIFELKRTESEPEHLLQVLRYGQKFGVYNYDQLNRKYKKFERSPQKDLQTAHKDHFGLKKEIDASEFNKKQKFVVVTNGIDMETLRSVKYWKDKGLPIEPLTYNLYRVEDTFLLDFIPYSGKRDEYEIAETKSHIVNTCVSYRPEAYIDMLDKKKASAYGGRKNAIYAIKEKDKVFLYHSGVGICAVGTVISEPQEDKKEDEIFVSCRFRKYVDPVKTREKALTAREINFELGENWSFRNTRQSVSDEYAKKIEKLFMQKA